MPSDVSRVARAGRALTEVTPSRAATAASDRDAPAAPRRSAAASNSAARAEALERAAREAFAPGKLSIRYDEQSGRFVYREIDPRTGEVLREFPPDEVLERLARLKGLAGVHLDRKA